MPIGAQVPYNPIAGVTPAEGVPANDANQTRANPNEFGGQVGEAEQRSGDASLDISRQFMMQASEAQAENTLANQFVPAAAQLKANFMQNKGMDAVKAQPQYLADIQDLRDKFISNAGGPYQAQIMSQFMARHAMMETDNSSMYAMRQQENFEQQSHDAMLGTFSDSAAHNYGNADAVAQNIQSANALTLKRGLDQGQDPNSTIPYMQAQITGQIVGNVVEAAIANNDMPSAIKTYDTYKDSLTPKDARDLEVKLAPKINDFNSRSISDHVLGQATQGYNDLVYGKGLGGSVSPIDFVMNHEGGFVTNDGGKGPTNFGVNQESNPDIDVKNITQDQARNILQTRYADKIGAANMSPALAAVAVDSAVNMGVDKTKTLLAQANGDPQKLIDLRRQEYQRLATNDPAKYAADLPIWNARLDDLQKTISQPQTAQANGAQPQSIASDGKAIPSIADYYKANYATLLDNAKNEAVKMNPNDPDFVDTTVAHTKQHMDSIIESYQKANDADLDLVTRGVNGDFTKGVAPTTKDQLFAASPDVQSAWSRLQVENPKAIRTLSTGLLGSKDSKTYGTEYWNTFAKIQSGDVTNLSQVISLADGSQLTRSGLKQIKEDLNEKTDFSTRKKAAFDIIKDQMVTGSFDIEGKKAWDAAIPVLTTAIQKREAAQIPPSQYFDPQNKEYIGNDVLQTMPSTAQSVIIKSTPETRPRNLQDVLYDASKVQNDPEKLRAYMAEARSMGWKPRPSVPLAGNQ